MKKYNYIDSSKRTLKIESDSIKSISNQLDASFTSLCECILNSKGALIVMGVGKSGHIGQKIAATLLKSIIGSKISLILFSYSTLSVSNKDES